MASEDNGQTVKVGSSGTAATVVGEENAVPGTPSSVPERNVILASEADESKWVMEQRRIFCTSAQSGSLCTRVQPAVPDLEDSAETRG